MLIRVELHCHTDASSDSLLSLPNLLKTCQRKKIDKVAITDHNTIQNALLAQKIAPEKIIVGEEILTCQGELLAFFVKEEIPAGMDALETIKELRQQGAFISISHPYDHFRKGHWQETDLMQIADLVDGIEVFNARCIMNHHNFQAQTFASKHTLIPTVGSDAHSALEVGQAYHIMEEFQDVQGFHNAIRQSKTYTRLSPSWVHLLSRYAKWKNSSRNA